MPGYNRRGPSGEGPMTGKKLGRCNPQNRNNVNESATETVEKEFYMRKGRRFGQSGNSGRGSGHGNGQAKVYGRGCRSTTGIGVLNVAPYGKMKNDKEESQSS